MTQVQNRAEYRKQRHYEIRHIMQNENQLSLAIDKFKQLIEELGPHLGLKCDIAACLYELGRYEECWRQVLDIAQDYFDNEHLLSANTKWRTALILSKFFEEMANPDKAVYWLNTAEKNCESQEEKKWILINKLRLLSYFKSKVDFIDIYYQVLELYNSKNSLKIEIVHSLMWSEWVLFGIKHALQRWFELKNFSLNEMDKRLIHRDFIEISLLSMVSKNDEHLMYAIDCLKQLELNDFDLALIKIFQSTQSDLLKENFSDLKLSRMMRFRLLTLLFKHLNFDQEAQVELINKFKFLQIHMDKKNQMFFKNIQPQLESTKQWILQICLSKKTASCKTLNFHQKLTRLQILLLKQLTINDSLDLDIVSQNLWQCQSDENIYHRIRMLVYKINHKLSFDKEFSILEIRKNQLTLNSKIKIELL